MSQCAYCQLNGPSGPEVHNVVACLDVHRARLADALAAVQVERAERQALHRRVEELASQIARVRDDVSGFRRAVMVRLTKLRGGRP